MDAERAIRLVSVAICLVVAVLILGPRPEWAVGRVDVSALPAVNASLNALTTLILLCGYAAIRARRVTLHRRLMLAAFSTSACFLCSYVVYHWFSAGPRHYQGDWRGLYLVILFTHVVLAAGILPFALETLYRGLTGRIIEHRRIAPRTLSAWLYVSITGVVIYGMLYG